ncbi:hypothetical protein A3Q56_05462, partial [Intoshia linei]
MIKLGFFQYAVFTACLLLSTCSMREPFHEIFINKTHVISGFYSSEKEVYIRANKTANLSIMLIKALSLDEKLITKAIESTKLDKNNVTLSVKDKIDSDINFTVLNDINYNCSNASDSKYAIKKFEKISHITDYGYYYIVLNSVNGLDIKVDLRIGEEYNFLLLDDYYIYLYAIFFLLYILVLAIIWTIFMIKHYKDLLRVQFMISLLLLFIIFEICIVISKLHYLNNNGKKEKSVIYTQVLFTSLRCAYSRAVMLAICLGYGITRPRLDGLLKYIFTLCITNFVGNLFDDIYSVRKLSNFQATIWMYFIKNTIFYTILAVQLTLVMYWMLPSKSNQRFSYQALTATEDDEDQLFENDI